MYAERVLSGMRPTGRLHLGHYHGVLKNWVELQHEYPCLFFVADWHALTTHYDEPGHDRRTTSGTWSSTGWRPGVDPSQATLFIQSQVPEHAELHLLLSMMTPLGWLERVPTYKDQQEKLADKDLVDLRLSRLSAAAGGRHPDLPRQHGAGRRRSGAARRVHPRDRAPLQPSLRPRAGLRGQGRARRSRSSAASAPSSTTSCARAIRSRATRRRWSRPTHCSTRRRTCRWATANACSAISKAAAR